MNAKNGIGAEVNVSGDFDAPNRSFFKVRIERGGRNGPLDFADGNFPRRPGGLHAIEGGFEFDHSRCRRCKSLEDAVGFRCEIAAVAGERSGGRINGHTEVSRGGGSQAQIVRIKDKTGFGEKYPVAALQVSLPKSEGAFWVKHDDLYETAVGQPHPRRDLFAGLNVAEKVNVFAVCDMTGKSFDGWTVCLEGKLRGNAFGFGKKDGAHIAIVNGGQRLRGGPNQPGALAKIEIERPDKAGVGRNSNRILRKDERTGRKIDHELHVFFRRHVLKALVIIHENESAFPIGTNAPAQGVKIIFSMWTLIRHGGGHSGQSGTPFMEKKMEASQEMVLLTDLTILAQGRLKVVVFNRHVVPKARGL